MTTLTHERPSALLARFAYLVRATFGSFVRHGERQNPAAVYETAIDERARQYRDLKFGAPLGAPAAAASPAEPAENGAAADASTFAEAKRRAVEGFEREFLLRALRAHGGNISRAAESIGMVRQSLQQKIRELDLRSEDWSDGDE